MVETVDDALARLERYRDTLRITQPNDPYNLGVSDGIQVAVALLRRVQVDQAYKLVAESEQVFGPLDPPADPTGIDCAERYEEVQP